MATTTIPRSRQNAAQIRALAAVEPEVRASDPTWRRKYLQDYSEAFRSYETILDSSQLHAWVGAASTILVGDYHSLATCQRFVAGLVKDCAQSNDRPVVLAVETIFSRDQHILDEWWRREICDKELRLRIRFDLDWGYDWDPFYELLSAAREHADAVFGLDCMPREDLRRIGVRDRHASHKIAEIRDLHPRAVIIALIGESHLAPTHLPALVGKQLPNENVVSILQNVDALYWRANQEEENETNEEKSDVRAVRVNQHTVCVFNSTPLEKYESYRICLNRWRQQSDEQLDFGPAIYHLIDCLLRFLDINRYSPSNGAQPKFLVDLLPEVYGPPTGQFRTLLSRGSVGHEEAKTISRQLNDRGCVYLPKLNAFLVSELRIALAEEEAARFVHHACQGLYLYSKDAPSLSPEDRRHSETLEYALTFLGSRILRRIRPGVHADSQSSEPTEATASGNDISNGSRAGHALGDALYRAYSRGQLTRTDLKRLFLFSIKQPGKAGELCSQLNRRLHTAP